jgi:hypothetical protein
MCLTCAWSVLLRLCASLDIIILDTSRGDLNDFSSNSYGLLLFSMKASSHPGKSTGSSGSSSVSVGELWPRIDELDGVVPRVPP